MKRFRCDRFGTPTGRFAFRNHAARRFVQAFSRQQRSRFQPAECWDTDGFASRQAFGCIARRCHTRSASRGSDLHARGPHRVRRALSMIPMTADLPRATQGRWTREASRAGAGSASRRRRWAIELAGKPTLPDTLHATRYTGKPCCFTGIRNIANNSYVNKHRTD